MRKLSGSWETRSTATCVPPSRYPQAWASLKDVVDHIDHVVRTIGIDHVGIGSDFDGGGYLADCRDVSEYLNLTAEMVRRGYSEADIRKIWGGNYLRVLRRVQALATHAMPAEPRRPAARYSTAAR